MLKCVERRDVDKEHWNRIVDDADEAWLFHRYEFQDALDTWPIYDDSSFAIEEDGEVLCLVGCHELGADAIECFGGPVIKSGLPKRKSELLLDEAHRSLLKRAQSLRRPRVLIRLSQMAPAWRGERCPRVNPLIFHGFSNVQSQSYVIDLRQSELQMWKSLHPNCRTHIRKAEREGCIVRLAEGTEADLRIYYDLHCETYRRNGIQSHPVAYFEAIWSHFVSTGMAKVFFAVQDDEVIAADNEIFFKGAMSGWTAAGTRQASSIGANNLLHWNAMLWAKANHAVIYESGEGFPGARGGKEKGLDGFKKSFGGHLYPLFRGEQFVELEEAASEGPLLDQMSREKPSETRTNSFFSSLIARFARR